MLISKFKRSDVIEDIKNWDKNVNVTQAFYRSGRVSDIMVLTGDDGRIGNCTFILWTPG